MLIIVWAASAWMICELLRNYYFCSFTFEIIWLFYRSVPLTIFKFCSKVLWWFCLSWVWGTLTSMTTDWCMKSLNSPTLFQRLFTRNQSHTLFILSIPKSERNSSTNSQHFPAFRQNHNFTQIENGYHILFTLQIGEFQPKKWQGDAKDPIISWKMNFNDNAKEKRKKIMSKLISTSRRFKLILRFVAMLINFYHIRRTMCAEWTLNNNSFRMKISAQTFKFTAFSVHVVCALTFFLPCYNYGCEMYMHDSHLFICIRLRSLNDCMCALHVSYICICFSAFIKMSGA